ncbi:hypothetical protein CK203_008760 [Vitis vinifera]|uniref:Rab-GAP TBC domain-containing protein n=1 Tax=Vitis vinifera TaxID=29760 RepID=A0A438KDL4_VITVI|nr:hypothetical protein CK203_008760 [Vitis vinifera]
MERWTHFMQLGLNAKVTFRKSDLSRGPLLPFHYDMLIWDLFSKSILHPLFLFSQAGKTLSARRWHAAFSQDGHLDIEKVLRRIQRGGVHPSIKGVVWEFLLGCFDPNSTFDERNELRQQRR